MKVQEFDYARDLLIDEHYSSPSAVSWIATAQRHRVPVTAVMLAAASAAWSSSQERKPSDWCLTVGSRSFKGFFL